MATEVNEQVQEPEPDTGGPQSADEIPQDRVFCMVYLYLNEDNQIAGGVDYKGNVLAQLEVPEELGIECLAAARLMSRYTREALDQAGAQATLLNKLKGLFTATEEDIEQSNDDSYSGEQSDAASNQ